MDLKEISATTQSPYRCYVRGNILQSEGENVHTIGFKDGLAVVEVIIPPSCTDMQRFRDNIIDSKAIDLSKLKKIIVKVDPQTRKKYILKDGKKIEILPQIQNSSVLNFKSCENRLKVKSISKPQTAATLPIEEQIKPNIIIKKPQNLDALSQILKASSEKVFINKQNASMKVIDNVKYHVLSLNVKKQGGPSRTTVSTMTDYDLSVTVDKSSQTDGPCRRDTCTQTEPLSANGRDSPFSDLFINFILGDSECADSHPRKMIDPNKLKTKEEINKFNFFNDMRNALNFDRSGNLPIHESIMQNNLKALQKNCIVLKAVQENVNITNQQGYTPLHLAIQYDVSVDIVKILLHHGADLSIADTEGNTAIHLAIEHRRSALLKVLVTCASERGFNFDVFNYEGFTPLILACLNRSYHDAKLLLQHKADPNLKDMKSGRTALFHAAESFDVGLVELLMEYKADTKIRNFFGTSAHDAMFEVEDMPLKIKFCILGRDHQRFQSKKKSEGRAEAPMKKAKLETTPVLKKVSTSDLMFKSKRK